MPQRASILFATVRVITRKLLGLATSCWEAVRAGFLIGFSCNVVGRIVGAVVFGFIHFWFLFAFSKFRPEQFSEWPAVVVGAMAGVAFLALTPIAFGFMTSTIVSIFRAIGSAALSICEEIEKERDR